MQHTLTDSKTLLAMARSLPPLPASTTRLAQLVESPDCNLTAVAEIIQLDPSLTLRLLKAANSAASASVNPIGTVGEAVLRLGVGLIVSLAFAFSVGPSLVRPVLPYRLAAGRLWRHSVLSAVAAEELLPISDGKLPPEVVTAALLHDIGKLILAHHATEEQFAFIHTAWEQPNMPAHQAEREILGLHHGEIGGLVAQHWKLPDRLCRAILYHHEPEQWNDPICFGVHIADVAARAMEASLSGEPAPAPPDPEILAALDLESLNFGDFTAWCLGHFEELRSCYGI